ncbi:AAA family ATPase [Paenibacillus lautus]|uniref:AAA family ATPase n=1 Tax=Paenibacillus lautus TaxID=1401 RepID=UPI003D27E402
MKRRINIGIALMHNPKLLVLDEPTVGIDPQSRNHILETVKNLSRYQGKTVIYTSHYMEEVEFLCDRVAIIDYGELITYSTLKDLKQNSGALDTLKIVYQPTKNDEWDKVSRFAGVKKIAVQNKELTLWIDPNEGNAIHILDSLRNLGIHLSSFQYEEVNLEHVFLHLTGKSLRD